jgi:hypothetical protein
MNVFVSVGTGLSDPQEAFVAAVEARLRAIGLHPCTIGRNTFSADAPLRAVTELMDRCDGAVVIALERYRFPAGIERPGSAKERPLDGARLSTPWNQIEAAMAYSRGLPLLVLVDREVRADGLLERGNDWYVQEVSVDPSALNSPEFGGILTDWRDRVAKRTAGQMQTPGAQPDPAEMPVGRLLAALKPRQLWALLAAAAGALGGAFALGAGLLG